jgi:hypothetical protein
VRTSALISRFWIRERISSLISEGFNCMVSPQEDCASFVVA